MLNKNYILKMVLLHPFLTSNARVVFKLWSLLYYIYNYIYIYIITIPHYIYVYIERDRERVSEKNYNNLFATLSFMYFNCEIHET